MLTEDKTVTRRDGREFRLPVAGGERIFKGALVAMTPAGFLIRMAAGDGLTAVGVARSHVDNLFGGDGAAECDVEAGVFGFENDPAGPVTRARTGQTVFAVDDETVSVDGTGRSAAGKLVDIDGPKVFVRVGPGVV